MTIEQSQKLSMTPELIQAINILQYNYEELHEFIQNELLENPMLEISASNDKTDDIDKLRENIADSNYNREEYSQWINTDEEEDFSFEKYVSFRYSLIEHLLLQLQISEVDEDLAEVGRFLIHHIDENGYLRIPLEEVTEIMSKPLEEVEKALKLVQTFDPSGVGARDLTECLTIQLNRRNLMSDTMKCLLENCIEDLADNRISNIGKCLGRNQEEVLELIEIIHSLEPKPGRGYDSDRTVKYVIPDVVVRKTDKGYMTNLFNGGIPTLMVSSYYDYIKNDMDSDPEVSNYLNERLNSAIWLLKCIEQRNRTILNVANAIVEYQRDFFDKGDLFLKPLTLKQVATKIGTHESTVSRAINGKYIETGRGVFEMKYFFTSGVKSKLGSDLSSNSIKVMIKDLVTGENPKKPLSDQKIVELLNEQGIEVSRRTVAKYRDTIGILPSSKRKRY